MALVTGCLRVSLSAVDLTVPPRKYRGNLVAFACKLSFNRSHGSCVFFENKTKLLARYQKALGAPRLFGSVRALNLKAAEQRIIPHFPNNTFQP